MWWKKREQFLYCNFFFNKNVSVYLKNLYLYIISYNLMILLGCQCFEQLGPDYLNSNNSKYWCSLLNGKELISLQGGTIH